MLPEGRDDRQQEASDIKQEIIKDVLGLEIESEISLYDIPEGIQHEHVDEKMQPPCMHKSISEKPVKLVAVLYIIGIELQPVEKDSIIEAKKRNDNGYADNKYRQIHYLKLSTLGTLV
jgi:hypothetical protein